MHFNPFTFGAAGGLATSNPNALLGGSVFGPRALDPLGALVAAKAASDGDAPGRLASGLFAPRSFAPHFGDLSARVAAQVFGPREWRFSQGYGLGTLGGTLADNAVTNAKLADMANARIKGRITAGTGDPEDLTAAEVRAILGLATVATSGSAADLSGTLAAARIAGVVVPASFASSGFAKVRARMSTNQSVSAATATTIQFNTVDIDTDGLFNNGVYTFSPAVSGDYDITLTVEISANDRMILMVWDTAAEVKRVFDLASGQCVTVGFEIALTTGNAYRFRLQTGGSATIVSGAAHTTVSIRRKP